MREILFRGKTESGKWTYGSLILAGSYCCILEPEENVHPYNYPYLDPDLGTIDGYATPVIPETVGQWTGLTDKNGVKIFEGDIVDVDGDVYVCRWDECNFEFGLTNNQESFGIAYSSNGIEVIGNIHDNPELLEVK